MSSTSSTSSFEYGHLERCPRKRWPLAAIGFVAAIAAIESLVAAHAAYFFDRAAWQWRTKEELRREGALDGDVAILGTSILYHALDPRIVQEHSGTPLKVVSLALQGLELPHQCHLLERSLREGRRYRAMLLEFWTLYIKPDNWISGPYWQFWATPGEWLESGVQYTAPELLMPFLANRALPSFAFNTSLANWVQTSLRARGINTGYRDRNALVAREMRDHHGFSLGDYGKGLTPDKVPPPEHRPFRWNASGEYWARRILAACAQHGIKVLLVLPPAAPYVERDRAASGYHEERERWVAEFRREFPGLILNDLAFSGYALDEFFDDLHPSHKGARKFSEEVALRIPKTID